MKKKVTSVLLLAVIMVFTVGYTVQAQTASTVPIEIAQSIAVGMVHTEIVQSKGLELAPRGTYHKTGFGDTYFIYRFDSPNEDIVVFKVGDSGYLVGADSDDTDGTSYAAKVFKSEPHQFVGLSDKYLLFITEDGLIAVAFKEKTDFKVGESCYILYSFDELSDEEKGAFIYPISYEKVTQSP